jgi:hypothetical protein
VCFGIDASSSIKASNRLRALEGYLWIAGTRAGPVPLSAHGWPVRYSLTRDETGRALVARADSALIRSAIDTNPTRYTPAITQSCSAIIIPLQLLPYSCYEIPALHRALALDYGTRSENLDGTNQRLNQCAIGRLRRDAKSSSRNLQ